jgi:hypothetical protein
MQRTPVRLVVSTRLALWLALASLAPIYACAAAIGADFGPYHLAGGGGGAGETGGAGGEGGRDAGTDAREETEGDAPSDGPTSKDAPSDAPELDDAPSDAEGDGAPPCAHSPCVTGVALDAQCMQCVHQICLQFPNYCTPGDEWDQGAVMAAMQDCAPLCN